MQRQDAKGREDPTTPKEVGAPRRRTQRPLTAEQQQQQHPFYWYIVADSSLL